MSKNKRNARLPQPDRIKPPPVEKERVYRREWEDYIRKMLKKYRQVEQSRSDGGFLEAADLTGAVERRRMTAVLNLLDTVYKRYPSFPAGSPNRLGELWIQLNYRFTTYTVVEAQSYILTAAAIWILDRIRGNDKSWTRMMRLLPTDDCILDEIEMPDLWDPLYEWELIGSVQWILQNRNGPAALDPGNCPRCITDDPTAQSAHRTDKLERKIFEALISLIPQEDIDRAKARFEELFWSFSDRTFSALVPLEERVNRWQDLAESLRLEHNAALDELDEIHARLDDSMNSRNRTASNVLAAPGKLPDLQQLTGQLSGRTSFPSPASASPLRSAALSVMEVTKRLNTVVDRFNEAVDELDDASNTVSKFLSQTTRQGYISDSQDFGYDAAFKMTRLNISDPFELCFALLYLVDQESDLPWAYGIGTGLMEDVCECLPWGVSDYDEDEDAAWLETDEKYPAKVPANAAMPDFTERSHERRGDSFYDFPRSIGQLIYEETGSLMPRDMHVYDSRIRILKRYGVNGKDAAVALACMNFAAQSRRQKKAWNLDFNPWGGDEEDSTSEENDNARKSGDLSQELKKIKAALHEAEKTARDARKELQNVKARAELEHRELADLREFVFNLDLEEPEEMAEEEAAFPYEVRKDTVIFGGHATWEKVIRPLLKGNVRFIDKDLFTFDPAIIRSADVVWIQPNAMSHTQYYRIIDTARQYKKPVRYFTHASAFKGAVQVMENDLAQD